MDNDPLGPFRAKPSASRKGPDRPVLSEHEALGNAIEALNKVPNYKVKLPDNYYTTYDLIPDLQKAYQAGEERARLEKIDAVIAEEKANLQAENARLKAENIELLETISTGTVIFTLASMEGVIDGPSLIKEELEKFNAVIAKYAQQERQPTQEHSTPEPERDIDMEPEV